MEEFDKKVLAANPEKMALREKLFKMSQVEVVKDKAKPGSFAVDWIKVDGPIPVGNIKLAKSVAGLFTNEHYTFDEATLLVREKWMAKIKCPHFYSHPISDEAGLNTF